MEAALKREEVAKRRLQALQERIDATKQRAVMEEQLRTGKYYCPRERVWIGARVQFDSAGSFEEMRREETPNQRERRQVGTSSSYEKTWNEAKPIRLHKVTGGDDSVVRDDSEDEKATWPTNLFGRRSAVGVTYLIPASYERASMYSDVARCVLALRDDAPQDIQQAIHGSLNDEGTRIQGTGIKHSPNNKIRFPGDAVYFENLPCVVIVPIMTLKEIRDWKLEGYEAIVLAGSYKDIAASEVYRGIEMTQPGSLATQGEIDKAGESLAKVVQGLAFSLDHRVDQRHENLLDEAMQQDLASSRTGLQTNDGREVIVPMKSDNTNLRVRKVTFQAHGTARVRRRAGHVAPDPLLLITKSAINWSWGNDQQLLATGEQPEEEIDEEDLPEE
jgi:hypothetical protein